MLAWFSAGYQSAFGLDSGCLRQRSNEELSQDNLFHSMLGLLEVRTGAYDPGLDLFAPCRAPEVLQRSRPTADGRCTPRKRLARSRRLPDTTRRKDYFLRLAEG